MGHQPFPLAVAYNSLQTNILIDRDSRPQLTDYRFIATISDPDIVYFSTASPYAVRYVAPELLNPPVSVWRMAI
jgi:hypothetical protein